MYFDKSFFQKFHFEKEQIEKYLHSADNSLIIAYKTDIPEVIFKFGYEAFIKAGMALIASKGYKVRSIPGHHVAIIEAMGEILGDPALTEEGNEMRRFRNLDLYTGGEIITEAMAKNTLNNAAYVLMEIRKVLS